MHKFGNDLTLFTGNEGEEAQVDGDFLSTRRIQPREDLCEETIGRDAVRIGQLAEPRERDAAPPTHPGSCGSVSPVIPSQQTCVRSYRSSPGTNVERTR
jgi:hypothetical protein